MANVKIIHPELGPDRIGDVPEESLPHHVAAGWRRLADDEQPPPPDTTPPAPVTRAQAAKTAKAGSEGK